jgi:hypothetical protein
VLALAPSLLLFSLSSFSHQISAIQLFAAILPPPPKIPPYKNVLRILVGENTLTFVFPHNRHFTLPPQKTSKQIMRISHQIMFILSQRATFTYQMSLLLSTAHQPRFHFPATLSSYIHDGASL